MKRAITERMDAVESDIQGLFTHLYCKRDLEEKLKEARRARGDRLPFLLRELADMINGIGKKCEYGRGLSYYSRLAATLSLPEDVDGINLSMIKTLTEIYKSYPTPREYMERIVFFLSSDEERDGSLELKILKRLLKTVNVRENKRYYSRELSKMAESDIDESVFEGLRDGKAKKGDTPPIVEAAYSLATGNFVSPVTTRELLFLFAFAFDMRYYPTTDSPDYRVERDAVKNLFEDYYSDNLTRYIYLEDGGRGGNSDKEPSGIGLNPKSFVDVIFIYYLNKEGISAEDKVRGFYRTVAFIKDTWQEIHDYDEAEGLAFSSLPTERFRRDVDTVISRMSEDEFGAYLLDGYYCDPRYTYVNKRTGALAQGVCGTFELRVAANSAYVQYSSVIELIKELLDLPPETDLSRLDRRTVRDVSSEDGFDAMFTDTQGVSVTRVSELEGNACLSGLEYFSSLSEGGEDLSDFFSIIKSLEKRLDPYEVIGISDPLKVTRTKLIAAYFHFYCLENTLDDRGGEWKSFKTVFEDMSYCLNAYLIDAGYQTVSSKNLYDVFVIFLAYSKINGFLN